jgi:hypothetical protein
MVPFVIEPCASGWVHDADTNRCVRSGIVQLASNDVACTFVTVPVHIAPLGRYSIWNVVDANV